jgi:hypothetical protein
MRYVLAVTASWMTHVCLASPILTAQCDSPRGVRQEYGISASELMASAPARPLPKPHFSGPTPDGFNAKPVFVIDPNRNTLSLSWVSNRGPNISPESPREIPVAYYSSEVIVAIDSHPGRNGSVSVYSFYPKLGVLFESMEYLDIQGTDASQSAFFAKCEFSWGESH